MRGWARRLERFAPKFTIVQGRMFRPGLQELVVGRNLGIKFPNLEPGDHILLQSGTWTIVGTLPAAAARMTPKFWAMPIHCLPPFTATLFKASPSRWMDRTGLRG